MEEINGRIQTRRGNNNKIKLEDDQEEDGNMSSPMPLTRSQSVDSNTSDSRKRRKILKEDTIEESRFETHKRSQVMRERLEELDKIEKAVKEGSHLEYHRLLENIEEKKDKMLSFAEMRKSLAEGTISNIFNSQKSAAYSQFFWDKLALRRSMMQRVQHKINMLEQEYYSNHVQSSLDEEHLTEWVPPDRPSMISSLTLGLVEEDVDNDIEWAKQDPNENSHYLSSSSLAENKQPTTDFSLPPLNPWRSQELKY